MKIISAVAMTLAAAFPALAFAQTHSLAHSTPSMTQQCIAQHPNSDIWLKQPSPGALGQDVYTHH